MLRQVGVRDGGLAAAAINEGHQVVALEQDALKVLHGLQPDAIGLVGVAVLVHQLLGVAVGLLFLFGGQLAAQLVKAQLNGGVGLQVLQRFPGDIIADGGRLAAVAVHGDGLLQKSFHVGGVLVGGSEVSGFLVGVVLGQQIQAGGDLVIAEGTHGVRGGDDTACQADHQGQRADQCKKFLFHSWLLLKFIFGFSQAWARLKSRPWP